MQEIKTKMKPSKYQQDIYNKLITTNKNIVINATAGAGKSTTLIEASKLIPYSKKAIFNAFNKHIVNELKNRLPANVECSTMHSVGFRCIKNHFPGEVKVNEKKQIKFIEPLLEKETNQRKKWKSIYAVDRVMRLARATMTKANRADIGNLLEKYALDLTDEEIGITVHAMQKFSSYNNDSESRYDFMCDFTDMIEFVALNDVKVPQYDYVFIDEAQDCSALDRILLNKLVKPVTGRKIICGDGRQAIYSFRGADIDSFTKFVSESNTIKLPLTVSYRCAKKIVEEARKVYSEIEPYEENEEGEVRKGKIEEIQEEDMVICRNTRPLIDVFLELISAGKSAYIVGKEMEQGLLAMIADLNPDDKTKDVWQPFLVERKEKIKRELESKGVKNVLKHPKYGVIMEKLSILGILFNKFEYVYQVEEFIKEIFEDEEREGIRLMTVHKSKGLESNRVFFIREFEGKELIPSQYAVTEDQLIAEDNLKFVGITRAKRELIYLDL